MFLRLVLDAVLITAICRLFDSHFLFFKYDDFVWENPKND